MDEQKEFTLYNLISQSVHTNAEGWVPRQFSITREQKKKFVEILSKRCSTETKKRLEVFINNPTAYAVSIQERYKQVYFKSSEQPSCYVVAEQSYPHEVRQIRNLICKTVICKL